MIASLHAAVRDAPCANNAHYLKTHRGSDDGSEDGSDDVNDGRTAAPVAQSDTTASSSLAILPNEILFLVLSFLDVHELLSISRVSHRFRALALSPILRIQRLREVRALLPPLLTSPSRPTLAILLARSIVMTHTTVVSRRLSRSLLSIRLSRRLASRPSAEMLVERSVLPRECLPGGESRSLQVAPSLVAKRRAVERERVKDGLRRWIGSVWKGEVKERQRGMHRPDGRAEHGTVWRLRAFWERVNRGELADWRWKQN